MKVKIDTREKFHAITVEDPILAANMTAELDECLLPLLQNVVKKRGSDIKRHPKH